MTEIKTIDARGLSCPQPALMTRETLRKESKVSIKVIVDNTTARENVSRTARNMGWKVELDERSEDEIHVIMNK